MALIFFGELLLLFFLSRMLTSELSFLFYKIFKSQKISIFLMALLFLPGTIIHEFAHAIVAKLLFVHVGKMELMPVLSGESLKLGSVQVGRSDTVRNFLIGIAPFVVGTGFLLGILYYAFLNDVIGFNVVTFLIFVLVFMISNTMYSSKKDMEGAIEFFILIIAPIIALYFLGVRIPIPNFDFSNYFKIADLFLAVPIIIDLGIIVFSKVVSRN